MSTLKYTLNGSRKFIIPIKFGVEYARLAWRQVRLDYPLPTLQRVEAAAKAQLQLADDPGINKKTVELTSDGIPKKTK